MAQELGTFLDKNFGLRLQGSNRSASELVTEANIPPALIPREQELVGKLRTSESVGYRLDNKRDVLLTMGFGPWSIVLVNLPSPHNPQSPRLAYATITPDTTSPRAKDSRLQIAYLGKELPNGSMWIPEEFDPLSGKADKDDVLTALSAINQFATVGEHQGPFANLTDPQHLKTAFAEFNEGSRVHRQIERIDPSARAHYGDEMEKTRRMLPTLSAESPDAVRNKVDLVLFPITFLPPLSSTVGSNVEVVITRGILDENALDRNNQIRPLKADKSGALQQLQEMGFYVLGHRKNAIDKIARKFEKGLRV